MSNLKDFNDNLAAIQAVKENDVKQPTMPVGIFVQEGEDLLSWVQSDKSVLVSKGLDPSHFDKLPGLLGALREAQSRWTADRNAREEAARLWKLRFPEAGDLHSVLIHDFLFAYRNDETLLSKVRLIADGSSHADMIQDLNDLAVLGRENPAPLQAINFDTALLERAANEAADLGELLAMVNGDRAEQSEIKILRDKAYTLCKNSIDEIRTCGQYAFWRTPDRLKGYGSVYRRKQNQGQKVKTEEAPSL